MASRPDWDYNRLVAQLHYQQRAIATLEAEKRELERRLTELRRGIGITVCIQGQTMSLTSPVVTVVSQSTEPPDPGITGMFPVMSDPAPPDAAWVAADEPAPTPDSKSRLYYNPSTYGAPTTGQHRARNTSQPQQSSWIRDSRDRDARHVNPFWLQDETVEWPPLNTPRVTQGRSATSVSRPLPRHRGPVEAPQFSTLADLTGEQPAVRPADADRRRPQDHNPFADSFVLG
jgi:hypothetical protein